MRYRRRTEADRCMAAPRARSTIGRKALLTAPRGRRLFGLTCEGVPGHRQPLLDGDGVAGHVTAGARSPFLDCGTGYARMTEAGDWIGRHLTVHAADGTALSRQISDLPFHEPQKRFLRGLDRSIP